MTIDQKQTLYRRDYIWPNTKIWRPQKDPIELLCFCNCQTVPVEPSQHSHQQTPPGKEQNWSRLGPMGNLIDPSVYPAHIGPAPQSDVSRYDQPNVFLKKLSEKYPLIFDCAQRKPTDFIARIDRDRMRSTYQVDFCKSAPLTYEDLIRTGGSQGYEPCPPPRKLPGDPCRPYQKYTGKGISGKRLDEEKTMAGIKCMKDHCLTGPFSLKYTEYQETYSKLGSKLMIKNKDTI